MKYAHGVIDLETIGNTANAPIVQIGIAVPMSREGGIATFNAKVEYPLNDYLGLKPDDSTIRWWSKQPEETQRMVFDEDLDGVERTTLKEGLQSMIDWIKDYKEEYEVDVLHLWSHATFDPPILITNLDAVDMTSDFRKLVHYRDLKDFRTTDWIMGDAVKAYAYGMVDFRVSQLDLCHHYAPDDAMYEIVVLDEQLRLLRYYLSDEVDKSHLHLMGEFEVPEEQK